LGLLIQLMLKPSLPPSHTHLILVSFERIVVAILSSSLDTDMPEDEVIKSLQHTIMHQAVEIACKSSMSMRKLRQLQRYISCDRLSDHDQLMQDYFNDLCIYPLL
jgi:hypothetical protein